MKKIASLVLWVLIVIAVVPMLLWMFGVFGPFQHAADVFGGADVMLTIAAIYLGLALVVWIALALMNVGKTKGGNGKLNLLVFGGLAVLAVVLWFFAGSETVIGADGKLFDDAFTLKAVDMGLYLAYIALGITVAVMLWGTVRKALK
jgi:ABC-type amino acid transport system permease subunit